MTEKSESKLPRVIDLTALQAALQRAGEMPEIADKVRRALVAQSCLADVREASGCVSALKKVLGSARGYRSQERGSTEASLLSQAIFLCVRATLTRLARRPAGEAPERGPIDIRSKLPQELALDLDALNAIRGQALAHVYFDRPLFGVDWHQGAILAVEKADGWLVGAATRRVQLDHVALARLERLLPAAEALLTDHTHECFRRVTDAINKASGDRLDVLTGQSMLDPIAFFGSAEKARAALTNLQLGSFRTFEG